jgi:hypothetical protein
MSKTIIIPLEFEEEPTIREVIEYINELGEELYFEVMENKTDEQNRKLGVNLRRRIL